MKLNRRNRSAGFALLVFVIILLGMAGLFGTVFLNNKIATVNAEKAIHDDEVLRKAKQVLLSYAVEYVKDDELFDMGRLPCPDLFAANGREGIQNGNCGARHANSKGFLPWKTLGIDVLRDSSGECLWYVVSGDYKQSPRANMLNEDTNGMLQVQDENGLAYHGANPGDRPVALIIAPGDAFPGQVRGSNAAGTQCQGNFIETNYLESAGGVNYAVNHTNVADQIWTYVFGSANSRIENSNFNDKIIWITKSEYWKAVKAVRQGDLDVVNQKSPISKLTKNIAQCMVNYANDLNNDYRWLPWSGSIDFKDYRSDANNGAVNEYRDYERTTVNATLMGRVPQDISVTIKEEANWFDDATKVYAGHTTDIFPACLEPDQIGLWQNWKDHFFYVVARDFEMKYGPRTSPLTGTRCTMPNRCLTVDAMVNKVAGIVFYSDSVTIGQSRDYDPVDPDEKNNLANYLETEAANRSNAHGYPVDAVYPGNTSVYHGEIGDLAYCITIKDKGKDKDKKLQVTPC